MRWWRRNKAGILIGAAVFAAAVGLGFYIWFHLTHTCVEWEHVPTCSYCVEWDTDTYIDMEGDLQTRTECARYRACRCCTFWEPDEEVLEKIIPPENACP